MSKVAKVKYHAVDQPAGQATSSPRPHNRLLKACSRGLRTTWDSLVTCFRQLWIGKDLESPKVILQTGFWPTVQKCIVHLPPLLVTTVVVSLNLGWFFIGSSYTGDTSNAWQSFDALAFQIAAKIFELSIVYSLATILMDLLRNELLSGSSGLPLGLVTAKTRFVDASFVFMPEFRIGICGLPWRKGVLLGFIVIVFAIIALLAGPSSALLMIPQSRNDWKMGGASYYLLGTNDTLWPSQFDHTAVGGNYCLSPSQNDLEQQALNRSSCIWSGYSSILEFYRATHSFSRYKTMTLQDGLPAREMILLGNRAYAVHAPTCLYSEVLGVNWYQAIFSAPNAQTGTISKFANARYRAREKNIMIAPSQMPVVKTDCNINSSAVLSSSAINIYYPLQFFNGSHLDKSRGQRYSISTLNSTSEHSGMSTMWLDDTAMVVGQSNNDPSGALDKSSAYLKIQIPASNKTPSTIVGCSIDARWIDGDVIGTGGFSLTSTPVYSFDSNLGYTTRIFKDRYGGYGRPVSLGLDWLDTLTPQIDNNASTLTALSSMLTQIGLSNNVNPTEIGAWSSLPDAVQAVVSTIVADGMSRSGCERNGGQGNELLWAWPPGEEPSEEKSYNAIMDGSYVCPFPWNYDGNSSDITQMYWSTTVQGLGYGATSTPYYLAISLLLSHAAIAVIHIVWTVFWSHNVSSTWSSLPDLLTLAIKSTPPPDPILANMSSGVDQYAKYKQSVRIRARIRPDSSDTDRVAERSTNLPSDTDGVEMIVGTRASPNKHRAIIVGQQY